MSDALVETRYGKVRGTNQGAVSVWKGIPFAHPPVGELRFALVKLWTLFDPSKVRALLAQPSIAVPTETGTPVLDFLIQTNSWLDTYQVILPI